MLSRRLLTSRTGNGLWFGACIALCQRFSRGGFHRFIGHVASHSKKRAPIRRRRGQNERRVIYRICCLRWSGTGIGVRVQARGFLYSSVKDAKGLGVRFFFLLLVPVFENLGYQSLPFCSAAMPTPSKAARTACHQNKIDHMTCRQPWDQKEILLLTTTGV